MTDKKQKTLKTWSKEDISFLEEAWNDTSITRTELANALGRTVPSIYSMANKLGFYDKYPKRGYGRKGYPKPVVPQEKPAVANGNDEPEKVDVKPFVEDQCVDIKLHLSDDGYAVRARAKFYNGWDMSKKVHQAAMNLLKGIDIVEVVNV